MKMSQEHFSLGREDIRKVTVLDARSIDVAVGIRAPPRGKARRAVSAIEFR
jgi:hypothetical protein